MTTSRTRMGAIGVLTFVAFYIAVTFKEPLGTLVHNGSSDSNDERLLPLLDLIQKRLNELENNDAEIAKTLSLLQEKWEEDKNSLGKLERPGSSSSSNSNSGTQMSEAPNTGLRKPTQSNVERGDGSCSTWTKLKLISCNRKNSHIAAYFMPYVAEHLGLSYEKEHITPGEDLKKASQIKPISQALVDEVYNNPNPGCTLFVISMPRPDDACYTKSKAFFEKAIDLRKQSEASKDETSPIKIPYSDTWKDEIYWNSKAKLVPLNNERPLLVYTTGEVFSRHSAQPKMDITLFRAQEPPISETLTAHFIQGISLGYRNQDDPTTQHYNPASLVIDETVKNEAYYRTVMENKKGFAAIINGAVIKRSHHLFDATVRFALASLLDDYKPVHGLGRAPYLKKTSIVKNCGGMDVDTSVCMEPFKFIISMENSRFKGYISEKIFDAKLSESVPIYFGASNIDEYVNMDSIVYCNVTESAVIALRKFGDNSGHYPKILKALGDQTSMRATDDQLVQFTKGMMMKELQPCYDEIKRLDGDDEAYLKKLKAPFYKGNKYTRSIVDGYVLAKGVSDVVRTLAGMTDAR